MKTIEQTRRELFEAWVVTFNNMPAALFVDERGRYIDDWIQCRWLGFNAAMDAVVIGIPLEWPPVCEKDEGANEMRDAVLDAIESTNLGLKIR